MTNCSQKAVEPINEKAERILHHAWGACSLATMPKENAFSRKNLKTVLSLNYARNDLTRSLLLTSKAFPST